MGGLPELLVELDDGTGTFPYDITDYVDLSSAWNIVRGRDSEGTSIDPSSLTISLKNDLGHFTLGSPVFGIVVDQGIRLTETLGGTVSARYTGFVQSWPTGWDSPQGNKSTATINAVDRLARLERRRLRSMLEQEILVDSPIAYYTLGEPAGATTAGDSSGGRQPVLKTAGVGDPVVFGNGTGPGTDGLTAAQFTDGQFLANIPSLPAAPPITAEVFFVSNNSGSTSEVLFSLYALSTGFYYFPLRAYLDSAGQLYVEAFNSFLTVAVALNDGRTHHVAAVLTAVGATWTLEAYLDGVSVGSDVSGFNPTVFGQISSFEVGGTALAADAGIDGTIAHVALWDTALSAGRVAAHYAAGMSGFAGEGSGDRVGRLASYANISSGDVDLEAGVADVVAQSTSGQSVMDALNDVVSTEGGVLFVAGDGKLTFQSRTHRVRAATEAAAAAITTKDVDPADLLWSTDKNYLVNYAEASRPDGATQVVQDDASIAAHEQYPVSLSPLVALDSEAYDAAAWLVSTYATVSPRLTSVSIDLLTMDDDSLREAVLGLELGDRITISGFPSQSPAATADLIVEGSSESQSINSWTLTLNTVPAAIFRAWVLEDPVYGVLEGPYTRLHY